MGTNEHAPCHAGADRAVPNRGMHCNPPARLLSFAGSSSLLKKHLDEFFVVYPAVSHRLGFAARVPMASFSVALCPACPGTGNELSRLDWAEV